MFNFIRIASKPHSKFSSIEITNRSTNENKKCNFSLVLKKRQTKVKIRKAFRYEMDLCFPTDKRSYLQ